MVSFHRLSLSMIQINRKDVFLCILMLQSAVSKERDIPVHSLFIDHELENMRIDRVLHIYVPYLPYLWWQKSIRKGQVRLNGKRVSGKTRLRRGQELRFFTPHHGPHAQQVISCVERSYRNDDFLKTYMIYENEQIIILNKPTRLAVQGGTNVKCSVDQLIKKFDFRLTHRLDKDTSGILILAKNRSAAQGITRFFREQKIQKAYIARVYGEPIEQTIIQSIQKKNEKMVVTHNGLFSYTDVKIINNHWILLFPKTGRKHQLRLHMQYVGTPIVGDRIYGLIKTNHQTHNNRLFLHAFSVYIPDIGIVYAPLPKQFSSCDQERAKSIIQDIWLKN